MFKVLEVPKEQDLQQFSRLLWQRKLSHRIHSLQDKQVLAVPKPEDISKVMALYTQWRQGQLVPTEQDSADITAYFSVGDAINKAYQAFTRAPVTLVIILLCILLAVIAPLTSTNHLLSLLLYPDFSFGTQTLNFDVIIEQFSLLQFCKMITPVLLHGGLMHLSFNMLWLWEFGKRIEARQPGYVLLCLIIVIALVSNTIQYVYGGSIRFGGMSGVVYGVFAYIWMWQLFDPRKGLSLPSSLIFFILISFGIMTYIGFASIADEAHIGGLLCGILYGAITATISRIARGTIQHD